jgi:RNA polymerase sigma-70 factor (ECF subfamily)
MDAAPETTDAAQAAEAAARRSYGKLVAFLAARTRDVAGAEDALSEAFASALADWPARGVPASPEAWLLTVARRRMVDAVRSRVHAEEASAHLLLLEELAEPADESGIPDERLRLMLVCAHPALPANVRAPLMLQAVLGFDAIAIGSAFLVAPAAMGQRLVRAKAKIREAGIAFEVPPRAAWPERLDSVLAAIYAVYAEGWSDAEGTDPQRRNLADEAIWLGRLLANLLPDEPEALGLLALMLHAQARRPARRDDAGAYVPLAQQDVARWDAALADEAEGLLRRASAFDVPGRYQLEAAVQSAHAVRRHGQPPDWAAIVTLYAALHELTASPLAALNRAVALAHAGDVLAGLETLDQLSGEPRLADYQPYWAARADLLARVGRKQEAADAYERAIGLERDPAVRSFLQRRALQL